MGRASKHDDMEMDSPRPEPRPERSFLQAFFGSFVAIGEYPKYAARSLGSALGHAALVLTLVCSLYAGLSACWLDQHVKPHLEDAIPQVPEIHIVDGVANTTMTQPHIIKVKGDPVFIIDTTREPQEYLDQYPSIVVLSAHAFNSKNGQGKVESYPLEGNFDLTSAKVQGWLDMVGSWTLPLLFCAFAAWQFFFKSIQVLMVAGVITLINKSRPDFSTHLRVACYALAPAMAWNLAIYAAWINGMVVPFSGLAYWAILIGITAVAASKIKQSPKYH